MRQTEEPTCKRPDRHVPRLVCGFPLPCPWHTLVIDTTRDPPVVELPVPANTTPLQLQRIGEIAAALREKT